MQDSISKWSQLFLYLYTYVYMYVCTSGVAYLVIIESTSKTEDCGFESHQVSGLNTPYPGLLNSSYSDQKVFFMDNFTSLIEGF
jgi:hypothetical protein